MSEIVLEPLEKLTKDIRFAAKNLGRHEARFLVDVYYMIQRNRIRAGHQMEALHANKEPSLILDWQARQFEILERNIKTALGVYSMNNQIGQWAESIVGIGPVISAGLLAHIDMHKAPTAGHIWRFAGQDPTVEWLGKDKATVLVNEVIANNKFETYEELIPIISKLNKIREATILNYALRTNTMGETLEKVTKASLISAVAFRPWNNKLKRLCWIIGESFVKVSNHKDDFYGKIYKQRYELETNNNEMKLYKDQAEKSLEEKNYDKKTDAYKAYIQGKLPKARIYMRAKRYAVKIFLSHWHWVAHEVTFNAPPPKPYIIDRGNHAHILRPPNF